MSTLPPTARVLVVDDDPTNRKLASAVLSWSGYEVYDAATGTLALTALQSLKPDLLVIDIQMPEMDGLSVIRTLKKRAAGVAGTVPRVIVTTALAEPQHREQAIEAGADEVLLVPFPLKRLVELASTLLERN